MNLKQQRFVDYYIESGDSGSAYEKAGYHFTTKNSRDVCACKLLRKAKTIVSERMSEISEAGKIRIESKRVLLWEIAQKASGKINSGSSDVLFVPDYKAAIAAISELNRMDGHHQESKIRITDDSFIFDAEILPQESEKEAETAEFIQLEPLSKNDK